MSNVTEHLGATAQVAEGRLTPQARLRAGLPRQVGPLGILLVLCVALSIVEPAFYSWANVMNIAGTSAVPLIIGVGLTFVLISGQIDLSVEGVVGLSAVLTGLLVRNQLNSNDLGWFVLPVIIALGVGIGTISGFIHARWGLPSFMVTLGMWYATLGAAEYVAKSYPPQIEDNGVRALATGHVGSVPAIFLVSIGVLALGYVVQSRTRLGRYAYAIGGDERSAHASGIPVLRYKVAIFALGGSCAALGGCLSALRAGIGEQSIGTGDLFTVISAVIVGGTAITGGVGSVLGTLVGVLFITIIGNGMVLLGVNPLLQTGVQGVVLVLAVAVTLDRSKIPVLK